MLQQLLPINTRLLSRQLPRLNLQLKLMLKERQSPESKPNASPGWKRPQGNKLRHALLNLRLLETKPMSDMLLLPKKSNNWRYRRLKL